MLAGIASMAAVIPISASAPSFATAPAAADSSGMKTIVVPKKFSPKPGLAGGITPGRVPHR